MARLFPVKKLRPRSSFDSYTASVDYATNQRLAAGAGRIALIYFAFNSGYAALNSILDKVPATVVKPLDVMVFGAELALAQFCHRWYQDAAVRSEETWREFDVARRTELAEQQRQKQSLAGADPFQAPVPQLESVEMSLPESYHSPVQSGESEPQQPADEPPPSSGGQGR